jgi:hypothetical protein
MDAKRQRRAATGNPGRYANKLVWQTETLTGAMQFAQVPTEQWEQETDAMDDVSLAQALYDAIAASSSGMVVVSLNAENQIVISHGVDAESEDN